MCRGHPVKYPVKYPVLPSDTWRGKIAWVICILLYLIVSHERVDILEKISSIWLVSFSCLYAWCPVVEAVLWWRSTGLAPNQGVLCAAPCFLCCKTTTETRGRVTRLIDYNNQYMLKTYIYIHWTITGTYHNMIIYRAGRVEMIQTVPFHMKKQLHSHIHIHAC